MKKIFSVLLSFLMMISVLLAMPFAAKALDSGKCGENVTYSFDSSTGTLTISGSGDMYDYYGDEWYDSPFENDSLIQQVIIENGITKIGYDTFSGCINLTNIVIPDSVTSIESRAFIDCEGLISIEIPNSVTNIGYSAFSNTGYYNDESNWENDILYNSNCLISVNESEVSGEYNLKNGTRVICEHAFFCCSELTNINIPDSVTSIGDAAFYGCSGLTSVILPDSVLYIDDYAFYGCEGLTSIEIPNSVVNIGYNAFAYCSGLTSLTIGTGITTITNSAFASCISLTSVEIPGSVTSINSMAFSECTALTCIYIPKSVTEIYGYAFNGCSDLKDIYYAGSPSDWNAIGKWDLNLDNITIHCAESEEFSGMCGDNVYYSLDYDTGTLTISGTGEMYDYYEDGNGMTPFYNNSFIKSVVIENGVTKIGDIAFSSCKYLTNIVIPDSVTVIGKNAFDNTGYYNDNSNWENNCLYLSDCLISVKESAVSGEFVIKNGTRLIGGGVFTFCTELTGIIIPESVISIGNYAFFHCSGLNNVEIPESVTSIEPYAFYGCTGLTSIVIPNNVSSIGECAFSNCNGLKELTIPCSAKIYKYAFDNCTKIEKITITRGTGIMQNYSSATSDTDTYNGYTPWNCSNKLKQINLENGITNIGKFVFSDLTSLTSIVIPDSVLNIGEYAFCDCTGLTSIEIPDSVLNIGEYAFCGCTGLTSIEIPDSVISIGDSAFYRCSNLQHIIFLNKDCIIYGSKYTINNTSKICGYNESTAKQYAEKYSRSFISLDGYDCESGNHIFIRMSYTEATCTQHGYAEYKCCLCGLYYSEDLPPIGHAYSNGFCTKCGAKDPDYIIPVINANETKTVAIEKSGDKALIEFCPKISGEYRFYSSGGYDTYGYLYDGNMTQLKSNDDSGQGSNFYIAYNFKAGKTYYFSCRFYSSSQTGSFNVTLETDLPISDPSSLIAAISEAHTYTIAEYTRESIEALYSVADEYVSLSNQSDALQSEYDSATAEILAAMQNLDSLLNYSVLSINAGVATLINSEGNETTVSFSYNINGYCAPLDVVKDGIINAKDYAYLLKNYS